jgi:hypothetical protein
MLAAASGVASGISRNAAPAAHTSPLRMVQNPAASAHTPLASAMNGGMPSVLLPLLLLPPLLEEDDDDDDDDEAVEVVVAVVGVSVGGVGGGSASQRMQTATSPLRGNASLSTNALKRRPSDAEPR